MHQFRRTDANLSHCEDPKLETGNWAPDPRCSTSQESTDQFNEMVELQIRSVLYVQMGAWAGYLMSALALF